MHSPSLYKVVQLPLKLLTQSNYRLELEELSPYLVGLNYGLGLRQVFLHSSKTYERMEVVYGYVYIDIGNLQSNSCKKQEEIEKIAYDGFIFQGRYYELSKRSSGQGRNGILSFVDSEIEQKYHVAITMGLTFDKPVVISKLESYLGLCLSSCHVIEEWR